MRGTELQLLRHGLPEGGGGRYRGNGVDDPLSTEGLVQMWTAVAGSGPWDRIVSSPLRRCQEFARALSHDLRRPLIVEPRIREVGLGAWEGRLKDEIEAETPGSIAAFRANPVRHRPPGAEPLEAFCRRTAEAARDLAANHPGERLLVVTHAGVIRALVAMALDLPLPSLYRVAVDHAGCTLLHHREGTWSLRYHNRRAPPPPSPGG